MAPTAGPDALRVRLADGIDLAHFLIGQLPGVKSVRAVRRLLAAGGCRVNGQVETFGSRRLRRGDLVDCPPPPARPAPTPRYERRRLLFDADGIVVYDKPPGLPVTPTDSGRGPCLEGLLTDALGPVQAGHRLDASTSGLVILAREAALAAALAEQFRGHEVHKTYAALVRGVPPTPGERRTHLVCRQRTRGHERWASGRGTDAREAITRWEVVIAFGQQASLLQVEPVTGRTHQIRVHLAEIGCPLLGDLEYGDRRDPLPCPRHLLHAERVRFRHPATGRPVVLAAQLPDDFRATLAALRQMT
jgi:RluA family pseudouridine synthase